MDRYIDRHVPLVSTLVLLAVLALAIFGARCQTGPVALPTAPQTPPPSRSLGDAMRMAEEALPATEAGNGPLREFTAEYRTLLRAGTPVALADGCRPISVAFAGRLQDSEREAWLSAALDQVRKEEDAPLGLMETAKAMGLAHYTDVMHRWPWSSLEAIYNLSTDRVLRLEAKSIWDAREARECARQTQENSEARRRPNSGAVPPDPIPQGIPDWTLPTKRPPVDPRTPWYRPK